MILGFEAIHLEPLLAGLRKQADLAVLPGGVDPFSHDAGRLAIAEAVTNFRAHVEDHADREPELRRGLAWLLNQPDDTLVRLRSGAGLPFPTPDPAPQRRYYEALWEGVFARWRIEDAFPPDELDVAGLP